MNNRRFPFYAAITYLYKLSEKAPISHRAIFFTVYDPGSVKIQIEKMKAELKNEKYIYVDNSATVHKIPENIIPMITVGDQQNELYALKKEYFEDKTRKENSINDFVEYCTARFCVTCL